MPSRAARRCPVTAQAARLCRSKQVADARAAAPGPPSGVASTGAERCLRGFTLSPASGRADRTRRRAVARLSRVLRHSMRVVALAAWAGQIHPHRDNRWRLNAETRRLRLESLARRCSARVRRRRAVVASTTSADATDGVSAVSVAGDARRLRRGRVAPSTVSAGAAPSTTAGGTAATTTAGSDGMSASVDCSGPATASEPTARRRRAAEAGDGASATGSSAPEAAARRRRVAEAGVEVAETGSGAVDQRLGGGAWAGLPTEHPRLVQVRPKRRLGGGAGRELGVAQWRRALAWAAGARPGLQHWCACGRGLRVVRSRRVGLRLHAQGRCGPQVPVQRARC